MLRQSSIVAIIATLFLCVLFYPTVTLAQGIPENRNVNIVGVNPPVAFGTIDNGVPDSGLKQQNEPACAIKPSNPLHIICAFNDYRGVDNPLIGDAWEGYAYSINGGQTWFSDLLPAHPGDALSTGFEFAADPQVVAAPGVALVSYIAANRGNGADGGLYLQRMFEVNREAGAPWVPEMAPIEISLGNASQFIDKPFLFLNPAPPGSGTITVSATLKDGTAINREVPAATLYLAHTVFIDNNRSTKTKLLVSISTDYGQSWKSVEMTKDNSINQSASLAAIDGRVCAVWRRFQSPGFSDAIMSACAIDGVTFRKKPKVISGAPEFFPFDQATSTNTFRVNSYPVIASDGDAFYAFWTSRDNLASPFFAQIMYAKSDNGLNWGDPLILEPPSTVGGGHQYMPTVASAQGVIQLVWYDTRNNLFQDVFIRDVLDLSVDPPSKILRNTGDVRTAQLFGGVPTASVQVSRYLEGALTNDGPIQQLQFNFVNDRIFKQGTVPFAGDYPNVAAPIFRKEGAQWVSNISASATARPVDFLVTWADNRDVRGNVWENLETPTVYTPPNTTSNANQNDKKLRSARNQNLRSSSGANGKAGLTIRQDAEPDPTDTYGACIADGLNRDRSRNQNIYSSIVRPGVSVDSPSASKPTGSIQRAHVIWVSNNTDADTTYQLTIDNQPPGDPANSRASFYQVPISPFAVADGGLLVALDVDIAANSTLARTVYVTSPTTNPPIDVSVSDGAAIILGTITLNQEDGNPDIQNPDVQNPDVQNPDIQNAEVHNPDIQNVIITNVSNPDVQNPDVQNPDVQNPDVQNPDVQNPDVQNPDVQNPDIQNPDVQNFPLDGGNIENPDVANDTLTPGEKAAGYTDVTFEAVNNGNTTSAFNVDVFLNDDTTGLNTQLIATRLHMVENSIDCEPGKIVQSQVVFNEINPDLSVLADGAQENVYGDGSLYVAPGETVYVTLRVWGDPTLFDPSKVGIRIGAQSCNTVDTFVGNPTCEEPIAIADPGLLAFDFENASIGDLFAIPSFSDGVITGGEFNGTSSDLQNPRGVMQPDQDNIYGSGPTSPSIGGGFITYFSFSTSEYIELTELSLDASTDEFDMSDIEMNLYISPIDIDPPNAEDTRIPALDNYTLIKSFIVPFDAESLLPLELVIPNLVLSPGEYHIAIAPSATSGIDTESTQFVVDNVSLSGAILPSSSESIFTETIISSSTDILADGLLVEAINLGLLAAEVTVNGVLFSTDNSGLSAAWTDGFGADFSLDGFQPPELDELLSILEFVNFGFTAGSLTIDGLTSGDTYRLQLLFENDQNSTGNEITVTVDESDSYDLLNWQPNATNLIIEFTASGSSVFIEMAASPNSNSQSGRAILNGYALHNIGLPAIVVP